MSNQHELKYCEDCRWFVDGHGFYMPFDRCTNAIAVQEHARVNLVRKTTQMARCGEARDIDGACGPSAKLFESRPDAIRFPARRRLWAYLFGGR